VPLDAASARLVATAAAGVQVARAFAAERRGRMTGSLEEDAKRRTAARRTLSQVQKTEVNRASLHTRCTTCDCAAGAACLLGGTINGHAVPTDAVVVVRKVPQVERVSGSGGGARQQVFHPGCWEWRYGDGAGATEPPPAGAPKQSKSLQALAAGVPVLLEHVLPALSLREVQKLWRAALASENTAAFLARQALARQSKQPGGMLAPPAPPCRDVRARFDDTCLVIVSRQSSCSNCNAELPKGSTVTEQRKPAPQNHPEYQEIWVRRCWSCAGRLVHLPAVTVVWGAGGGQRATLRDFKELLAVLKQAGPPLSWWQATAAAFAAGPPVQQSVEIGAALREVGSAPKPVQARRPVDVQSRRTRKARDTLKMSHRIAGPLSQRQTGAWTAEEERQFRVAAGLVGYCWVDYLPIIPTRDWGQIQRKGNMLKKDKSIYFNPNPEHSMPQQPPSTAGSAGGKKGALPRMPPQRTPPREQKRRLKVQPSPDTENVLRTVSGAARSPARHRLHHLAPNSLLLLPLLHRWSRPTAAARCPALRHRAACRRPPRAMPQRPAARPPPVGPSAAARAWTSSAGRLRAWPRPLALWCPARAWRQPRRRRAPRAPARTHRAPGRGLIFMTAAADRRRAMAAAPLVM